MWTQNIKERKENPMSNSQQNGNKFRLPRRSDKDYKISKLLIWFFKMSK